MSATPIAAAPRAHTITAAPATVVVAVRLVVAPGVAHSDGPVHTYALDRAGAQYRQQKSPESRCHPPITHDVHFGSTLLSLSVHSINPNGAPAGSATTATCPP